MSLFLRTLRSGSSGNGLVVAAHGSALLVDLGIPARTALKEILAELRQRGIKLIGALVTHEHSDHFSPGPLRAMSGHGVPVHAPRRAIDHAERGLRIGHFSGRPTFIPVDDGESWERTFTIGPFTVRAIEVGHQPGGSCFAYRITVEGRTRELSAVCATDLCDPRALPAQLRDADLIYLECNHDPQMLRQRPNWASAFHLENSRCGRLLAEAVSGETAARPTHVCLGHLSELRNTPALALKAVEDAFAQASLTLDFSLTCAPRHHASAWMEAMDSREESLAACG